MDKEEEGLIFGFLIGLLLAIILSVTIWVSRYHQGTNRANGEWIRASVDRGYLKYGVDEKTGNTYFLWLKPETGKFERSEKE
jgi:hypothetical protein